MTARLYAATLLVAVVVLLAGVISERNAQGGISLPLQAAMILLAAAIIIVICLKQTNPLTLLARAAIMLRAISLFAHEIIQGAWERRTRWRECKMRARGEV